jgi:hypothetical protein
MKIEETDNLHVVWGRICSETSVRMSRTSRAPEQEPAAARLPSSYECTATRWGVDTVYEIENQ